MHDPMRHRNHVSYTYEGVLLNVMHCNVLSCIRNMWPRWISNSTAEHVTTGPPIVLDIQILISRAGRLARCTDAVANLATAWQLLLTTLG